MKRKNTILLKNLTEKLAEQKSKLQRIKFYYQAEMNLSVAQINFTKKQIDELQRQDAAACEDAVERQKTIEI